MKLTAEIKRHSAAMVRVASDDDNENDDNHHHQEALICVLVIGGSVTAGRESDANGLIIWECPGHNIGRFLGRSVRGHT
eukprot:CAMPEP_0168231528 /NCGR_PEP_ID=MMETSP0140_2-20121125/16641_1 /TAXON_ID=44445 /ORGANISM="Pseudo-nitzschia australis, Strain 10249 10 AB" /LENGTH=78 /DNA_ID=CAMNT_0008163981 /DNA_START=733 /DNA_END=967 /DNA_ORIENTATION=-